MIRFDTSTACRCTDPGCPVTVHERRIGPPPDKLALARGLLALYRSATRSGVATTSGYMLASTAAADRGSVHPAGVGLVPVGGGDARERRAVRAGGSSDGGVMSDMERYGCAAMLVVLPVAAIVRVLAMVLMWSWFVMPLGVPPIEAWQAFGLDCLRSVVTPSAIDPRVTEWAKSLSSEERAKLSINAMVRSLGTPLAMLAIGYVVHHFGAPS